MSIVLMNSELRVLPLSEKSILSYLFTLVVHLSRLKSKKHIHRTSEPHISQLFSNVTNKTQYKHIRREKKKLSVIAMLLSVHFLCDTMISQVKNLPENYICVELHLMSFIAVTL